MNITLKNLNSTVKVSTNVYCIRVATDHWKDYRGVFNEKLNVISIDRGFRTNNHSSATYEQVKKDLSYLYPTRLVETDGIHTELLFL